MAATDERGVVTLLVERMIIVDSGQFRVEVLASHQRHVAEIIPADIATSSRSIAE